MSSQLTSQQVQSEILERFKTLQMLWNTLQTHSTEAMQHKPAPNAWSANECLKHLNIYGTYYLPLFQQALSNPSESSESYREGWLGALFIRWMSTSAEGYPEKTMSAPPGHRPKNNLLPGETMAEFAKQFDALEVLMRKVSSHDLSSTRIPISIGKFIRLKTGDVLRFYLAHHVRHLHQAIRAIQHNQH